MIKFKQISDDIDNICLNICDGRCQRYPRLSRSCEDFLKFNRAAKAQLQSCQKQLDDYLASLTEEGMRGRLLDAMAPVNCETCYLHKPGNYTRQDCITYGKRECAAEKIYLAQILSIVAPWLAKS